MLLSRRSGGASRRGSVLPLVVLCMVGLCGFVALAVDLGMIAVARAQCQNAADAGAMAGVRTLNGDVATNNNYDQAGPAAVQAATDNRVLTQTIPAAQVQVVIGKYYYDLSQAKFIAYPLDPGSTNSPTDNWTLVNVTVSYTGGTAFARVFGISAFNTGATATAIHRPRDVALVLDFSGSMRFASLMGLSYWGVRSYGTNNPESVIPLFGPYSAQSTAALRQTNASTTISGLTFQASNVTASDPLNDNRPPVVGDFYQHAPGTTPPVAAFTPAPASYASAPGGDVPLKTNNNSGANYAKTVKDVTGSTTRSASFEANGYPQFTNVAFRGYTQGPSYWGKTFFIWPPDPRPAFDWRKKFFLKSDKVTRVDDNNILWTSAGVWKVPRSGGTVNYYIDYQAILGWLQSTPSLFGPRMHAGRILYYDALPNANDGTLNNRFWTQFPLTDLNERFWKDYIDYVLGFDQTSATTYTDISGYTGYGDTGSGAHFSWSDGSNPTAVYAKPTDGRYMDYRDNPRRPRTQFWFGPMTMVDFLGNYNRWGPTQYTKNVWWPGTCHEAPLYACKLGVQAALQDSEKNHPNDWLSLIFFSVPKDSPTNNSYGGRFNRVRAPIGRSYDRMIGSLWYPQSTPDNPGTLIRPYDFANNIEVPRAMGGTCYSMALMLAYNQFTISPALRSYNPAPAPAGDAGGLGRKGAQKMIIFETDGAPNTMASAPFTDSGPYSSYYNVRTNSTNPSAGEFPSTAGYSDNDPNVTNEIFSICQQICAPDTASPPGYSTPRKPALIHTIAFGPQVNAAGLATLQQMQYIGSTQASPSDPLPAYKIVNGTDSEVATALQQAVTNIMQAGVPVSLIR